MPTIRANSTAADRQQAPLCAMWFAERPPPLHAQPTLIKCDLTDTHHSHRTGTAGQRMPLAQNCKIRICSGDADTKTHPACPPSLFVHMQLHTQMHIWVGIHTRISICAHTHVVHIHTPICTQMYTFTIVYVNKYISIVHAQREARARNKILHIFAPRTELIF